MSFIEHIKHIKVIDYNFLTVENTIYYIPNTLNIIKKSSDINYKFIYTKIVGKGAYGLVLLYKNKEDTFVIKILRTKKEIIKEIKNIEIIKEKNIKYIVNCVYGLIDKYEHKNFNYYCIIMDNHTCLATLNFRTLDIKIKNEILFTLKKIYEYFLDNNIYYIDLKPENILYKIDDKNKYILYICDLSEFYFEDNIIKDKNTHTNTYPLFINNVKYSNIMIWEYLVFSILVLSGNYNTIKVLFYWGYINKNDINAQIFIYYIYSTIKIPQKLENLLTNCVKKLKRKITVPEYISHVKHLLLRKDSRKFFDILYEIVEQLIINNKGIVTTDNYLLQDLYKDKDTNIDLYYSYLVDDIYSLLKQMYYNFLEDGEILFMLSTKIPPALILLLEQYIQIFFGKDIENDKYNSFYSFINNKSSLDFVYNNIYYFGNNKTVNV